MPAVAEQEMIVSGSLTGTEYITTITDSHYQIEDNGNVVMIVKMYLDPCYPFEAEARISGDGTIFFLLACDNFYTDDLKYHLVEVLSEDWELFFEGDVVNGTTITFPNSDGQYGENLV